jgi:hypothetical protein
MQVQGQQAPQLGYGQPPQQAPMPQGHAPQGYAQQPYGAPPQPQQAASFPPGSRVQVAAPDGNRYPATIAQEQNGHYLCVMPNGEQHWFPAGAVGPG